jgi:hypothetical protein
MVVTSGRHRSWVVFTLRFLKALRLSTQFVFSFSYHRQDSRITVHDFKAPISARPSKTLKVALISVDLINEPRFTDLLDET